MIQSKITPQHLNQKAYVYVRQSTLGQVLHHQESTQRQYALKEKALELGWRENEIRVLDRDLGQSGAQSQNREDFKTLLADVSLGEVGAVLALEASRLARSNADWHRLIELCSLTGTLILDEDGIYDPADFNDGLTVASIRWIRHKHRIAAPQLKFPHELTVDNVASRFHVSRGVVYYWIKRDVLPARRLGDGHPYWITLTEAKAEELQQWVQSSKRIASVAS